MSDDMHCVKCDFRLIRRKVFGQERIMIRQYYICPWCHINYSPVAEDESDQPLKPPVDEIDHRTSEPFDIDAMLYMPSGASKETIIAITSPSPGQPKSYIDQIKQMNNNPYETVSVEEHERLLLTLKEKKTESRRARKQTS